MTNTITTQRTALAIALAVSVLSLALSLPGAASAALLTQQLDLGMQNSDVTSLQTFLTSIPADYPSGLVTGYFGAMTQSGVSAFQSANGLAAVGRVGPLTLAAINSQMGGGSVGTTGDVNAPIMSPEVVTTTQSTATFSWTTNESANDRVLYSSTYPFLYATASSVSATGYGTATSISLTGLQSNATYYYVVQSVDSSGNVQETIPKQFITS